MNRTVSLPLAIALVGALSWTHSISAQGVQIEKAPDASQSPPSASASPQKPKATPPPTAAESLYDYFQANRIEVAKDTAGTRMVWTDRILIEITDTPLPEPLASLLAAAPGNNGQLAKWVHDNFETQTKAWHPAKRNPHPAKAGTDELVGSSAGDHCFLNPIYLAYVLSRYPTANILIKGTTDPALFTVKGQLRAVIAPWTKLPDGTPLL